MNCMNNNFQNTFQKQIHVSWKTICPIIKDEILAGEKKYEFYEYYEPYPYLCLPQQTNQGG